MSGRETWCIMQTNRNENKPQTILPEIKECVKTIRNFFNGRR